MIKSKRVKFLLNRWSKYRPREYKSNLLTAKPIYKPFRYPWAYDAWLTQQKIHWISEEVPMSDDVKDWKIKLTSDEKNFLTQIFRFFTQADIEVNNCYITHYARVFKPIEILMMISAFANMESMHVDGYSKLIDTVGMPEIEYSAFLNYKEMKDKYEYMHNFNVKDNFNIALTLAGFGAFTEGLQLFASFAMLLNFQRFGKMKGMCQIVAWSVRDECYSADTEILTARGWKLFPDLTAQDQVAQFDADTKEISFVKPKKIVFYDGKREMISLSHQKKPIDFKVTENHRVLMYNQNEPKVIEARDIRTVSRLKIPVAGYYKNDGSKLSFKSLEKLLIIFNVNKSEARDGGRYFLYDIEREKIGGLKRILKDLSLEYTECQAQVKTKSQTSRANYSDFQINSPQINLIQSFNEWVDLSKADENWCEEFFSELSYWNSQKQAKTKSYYGTSDINNINVIQAIASLCGWSSYYELESKKKKAFHKISLTKGDYQSIDYSDEELHIAPEMARVWCVEVDAGFIVVRRNNCVCISGNSLHTESIIKLFHTFLDENPQINNQKLKDRIIQICRDIIRLEDEFIRLAFNSSKMEGLTEEEMKKYIRFIANRRLIQLGYEPIFQVFENPLPWLDEILNGVEFTNFFENRVTEYSKASTRGDWNDDVFKEDKDSIDEGFVEGEDTKN